MDCSGFPFQIFKRLLFIASFIALLINPTNAQVRTVSGLVTHAETGMPLPGVNVIVQGTTLGTTTDKAGQYMLEVPDGYNHILFSCIGMRTAQVEINDRTIIDLEMEVDVLGLDEVVVTALGQTREKKSLGYAVQDLSGEEIGTAPEKNIINSLQGRLAGVQISNSSGNVSSGSRILIRGTSILQGNNQPLFIVDGIAMMNNYDELPTWGGVDYGNTAMDLNPSDIESISILKGANAAALYGSRAVNGVVLITTKKSKLRPGQRENIEVTLESNFTWDKYLKLPEYQNLYGQGYDGKFIYVDGFLGGLYDGVDESWGPPLDYIVQAEDLEPGGDLYWTVEYGIPQTVGQTLVLPQFDSPYDPLTDIRTPTPWISRPDNVKDIFKTGFANTNTLSLSGAGKTANFRLSLGNQYVEGIIPNTDLKKYNVSFTGDLNISTKFRIGITTSYINNRSDNIMIGGSWPENILGSTSMWFGRQVDVGVLKEKWDEKDQKTGKPFNWIHYYWDNPYYILNKHLNSRNRDRFIGNVNAEYRITPSLSLSGIIGNDWYTERRKEVHPIGSENALWPDGTFYSYLSQRNQITARGQLHYNRDFGDLSIVATGGGEYNRYNYHHDNTYVDALLVPDLYAVSNAAVPATTDMREEHKELQSVFGMINLGYKDYLFLDLTARNDWSSTLPSANNSYFYPSASVGFILTEALRLPSNVLSYLKFRASYAEVGGSAAPYQLMGKYESSQPFYGNPALTYTDTRPPYNLKPQNKKSVEFGTEIKFISNRLGLDVTWYKENTINQIIDIDIPGTTGFSLQTINAGNLQNQGWELVVRASPIRSPNFTWDISVNWARNINEVISLFGDIRQMKLYGGQLECVARVGEPYGQIWWWDVVREHATHHYYDADSTILDYVEYTGRPVVDTSGKYQYTSDNTLLGNVMPDWFGGIHNAFTFRNFNLSFLVDFRKGGDQFSMTHDVGRGTGILAETARINANGKNIRDPVSEGGGLLIADGVYGEVNQDGSVTFTDRYGNEVDEPVQNTTYVDAEEFYHGLSPNFVSIFDASFVKLREVIVGYTFHDVAPWISNINLSFVGRNLWIIKSNMPGIDPENAYGAGEQNIHINSNPIPSSRSLGFNVKVTF